MKKQKESNRQSQEHTIMFAGTLPSLFDSIHSRLHDTIRTQVSTLPIIQSSQSSDGATTTYGATEESCDEKIYKRISKVYTKHLDMAQLYAEKEIFCLDKEWKKSKREKIVHLFLELQQNQGGGVEVMIENQDEKSQPEQEKKEKDIVLRYKLPLSKNEIPSAEEFASLRHEITSLRQELRHYIVEKRGYYRHLQALENVIESGEQVDDILSNKIGAGEEQDHDHNILDLVKQATEGQTDLKKYIKHGKDLINEMDRLTQEKDPSNETQEFSETMKVKAMEVTLETMTTGEGRSSGQHKRTLEEDYKERTERIKIKGDVLKQLFKK